MENPQGHNTQKASHLAFCVSEPEAAIHKEQRSKEYVGHPA